MSDDRILKGTEVAAAGLDDWRLLLGALHSRFRTGDFVTGVALIDRVTVAAEEENHHPDVDLRYPHVDIRLLSHDVGGVTDRDVRLARRISEIAADMDVEAEPAAVVVVDVGLDTADRERIKPFWRTLLDLRDRPGADDALHDPSGRRFELWFQGTEPHATPRQRFHMDVLVARDTAEQRVADALDAGGTLVSDADAPAFWVLADADGNKACICTWEGRD